MKKIIIDYNQFTCLISSITRDITLSDWQPDYIVGITRGGLLPAVMISHYLNVPCNTLKVSLRDGAADDCESNLWMAEDAFNGKNILIVDDINDQGSTINWIMKDWTSGCVPSDENWNIIWNNNVRFAVVVDNLSSKADVKMDYAGLEINKAEDDVWIDFPYEEWWTK
jgi:hypoxanthine phosphoribosyltransferase